MSVTLRWTEKDPNEVCPVALDFAALLATGETIASVTAAAFTNTDPPVSTTDITILGTGISGTVGVTRITGGVSGTDYLITLTATTSLSNVYPRSAQIMVGVTS